MGGLCFVKNSSRAVGLSAAFILASALLLPPSALAADLVPVRIGSQSPPIFEYVYISYAIDGGFLKKEGIDGKFVGFTSGLTATQALAGGSVDVACDGFTDIVGAIGKGAAAKVAYAVNSDSTYVIVTRDTITKPADLRGKKWAVSQVGAISQTYAALWLKNNGLAADSVDWIPIGGTSARGRAVMADQVDATLLTLGEWIRIEGQKDIHLLARLSDSVPPLPLDLCAVSDKLLKEHPAIVQKVVNGILNAVRYARTPEGREQYIKVAKEVAPSNYTDKQYEEMYDYYFGPKGNPMAVDPNGGLYPEVYVSNMKTMVEDKKLAAVLPLDKIWDPSFVNEYLGEHGWFDIAKGKGGLTLRDLISH